jgi:hypothetical protein
MAPSPLLVCHKKQIKEMFSHARSFFKRKIPQSWDEANRVSRCAVRMSSNSDVSWSQQHKNDADAHFA